MAVSNLLDPNMAHSSVTRTAHSGFSIHQIYHPFYYPGYIDLVGLIVSNFHNIIYLH